MSENNTKNKESWIQLLKFTFFSISAALVQIAVYSVLFAITKIEWLSHLVALIASVLWNFTLNRKFTFKAVNDVRIAMLKVALFYVVFTPLSTWGVDGLAKLEVNPFLIEVIAMVTNFVLEFLYYKFVIYREKK